MNTDRCRRTRISCCAGDGDNSDVIQRLQQKLFQQQQRAIILPQYERLMRSIFGSWGTCHFLVVAMSSSIVWGGGLIILEKATQHQANSHALISLWVVAAAVGIGVKYAYQHLEKQIPPAANTQGITVPADWVRLAQDKNLLAIEQTKAQLQALEEQARLERNTARVVATKLKKRAARL